METAMRTNLKACALVVTVFAALAGSAHAEDKVELKVVKYPELAKTIKQFKGKVVVVDFWADW
jgi:thiol:disulfide interchange protein